jgi:hypothetical protein
MEPSKILSVLPPKIQRRETYQVRLVDGRTVTRGPEALTELPPELRDDPAELTEVS